MKKFLFSICVTFVAFTALAETPQVVRSLSGDVGLALSANNSFMPSEISINEAGDVTYTVFNEEFNVLKQFTLRNLYKNPQGGENNFGHYVRPCFNELTDKLSPYSTAGRICLTQDVFNDDDKWEVIIEEYDYSDYIYSNYKYKVYNEDGVLVTTFTPDDYANGNSFDGISYSVMGSHKYLTSCYFSDIDSNPSYIIFSFKRNGSGVNSVASPVKNVAYPNPLHKGEVLTIKLNQPAVEGAVVIIADISGRILYRRTVIPGASEVKVSSASLHNGHCIYTFLNGDNEPQSGKLIVK